MWGSSANLTLEWRIKRLGQQDSIFILHPVELALATTMSTKRALNPKVCKYVHQALEGLALGLA